MSTGLNYVHHNLQMINSTVIPELIKYIKLSAMHPGDMKWSCQSADAYGWMLCDGRALSKEEYKDLYDVIGAQFGGDDDTFNLPDFRGRVMGAVGSAPGLTSRSAGDAVGREMHTLALNQLPSHTHTGSTSADGGHNHGGATASNGSHTHTTNANGGQGGLGLAGASGANTAVETDSTLGELNLWTTPSALTISSAGSHSHNISSDGQHAHTFTTNATGGGQAFDIMQPTLFAGNVFIYSGVVNFA